MGAWGTESDANDYTDDMLSDHDIALEKRHSKKEIARINDVTRTLLQKRKQRYSGEAYAKAGFGIALVRAKIPLDRDVLLLIRDYLLEQKNQEELQRWFNKVNRLKMIDVELDMIDEALHSKKQIASQIAKKSDGLLEKIYKDIGFE